MNPREEFEENLQDPGTKQDPGTEAIHLQDPGTEAIQDPGTKARQDPGTME